ncbi:hypothetical protein EHM92_04710 [bacterium]|nr:MAG: hypothetical protein EHM92_04710 [bacterium]
MAALSAVGLLTSPGWLASAEPKGKLRIHVIYALHAEVQPIPDWPNKGYDFRPAMETISNALRAGCTKCEFVTSMAAGADQTKKILKKDKARKIDGYVVVQMNCWNEVVQTIAASGKPVLYADFQFAGSGGFLVYMAAFLRKNTPNIGFMASSKLDDLVEAVNCFEVIKKGGGVSGFAEATRRIRVAGTPKSGSLAGVIDNVPCLSSGECLRRLKESRILAVSGKDAKPSEEIMGIPVDYIPFSEVNDAWAKADKDEAKRVADMWQKNARLVEGVPRETLESSAAMYLAQKAVMKNRNANAITINCLGGFYDGHIHAYPCLGFHQLLNEGLIGACECDVRSTATMVAFTTLTQGRPGYISDPVIGTAKRQIIYSHCVAHNRPFGPEGPATPFEILTHSEDRQGASVRSILPAGYMTTSLECDKAKKEILLHRAMTVDNDPDDRACRTKLCAEPVGDIERLFTQWDKWGWHRVTYYGDLKEPAYGLADALGWKVVEEA